MVKKRKILSESERREIISKSNNRCCICQTPFIVIHHIDEDPSNNDPDNLAPLCPNCHNMSHSNSPIAMQLTQARIKELRNRWYGYCEVRKEGINCSSTTKLRIKNFVRSTFPDFQAQHGWAKTFISVDPRYKEMTVDEIIDQVFSTTNPDEILTYLGTMKIMYQKALREENFLNQFIEICNALGVDYHAI